MDPTLSFSDFSSTLEQDFSLILDSNWVIPKDNFKDFSWRISGELRIWSWSLVGSKFCDLAAAIVKFSELDFWGFEELGGGNCLKSFCVKFFG